MRARVASDSTPNDRGSTRREQDDDASGERPVRRWSISTRVRVRARNVLRRWAAAQNDPRLVWVDPFAPAGNFIMIADLLANLRQARAKEPSSVELTDADLDDLWRRWLQPFAGTGEADGWLDGLSDRERLSAAARMPERTRGVAAALSWLLIRPGPNKRERVVKSQPVLDAAIRHGIIEPIDATVTYLTDVTGARVTRSQVDDDLLAAVEFIDDPLWCERVRNELQLEDLTLEAPPGGGAADVRLNLAGIDDPLGDPRVPRLVADVRHYRRCNGVAVFSTDRGWRLVFSTGETIAYRQPSGAFIESTYVIRDGMLEGIAGTGGVLSDLFAGEPRAAG
jgi:hypothetical protein